MAEEHQVFTTLRAFVADLLVRHPELDPEKVPLSQSSSTAEAAALVGYLMDVGTLGIIGADIGATQRARYPHLDVIPVRTQPRELLRNP